MNLVDMYVERVVILLPSKKREEVRKKLHEEIDQMLTEKSSEADVSRTLEKLGDPAKLAVKYLGIKPYLIAPEYFYSYLSTLKLASIVIVLISIVSTLIEKITTDAFSIDYISISIELSIAIIAAFFQGIAQAFLWVTIVYEIVEYQGVKPDKLPYYRKKWSVDSLFEKPAAANKGKISRTETIFGMFFTILFTFIICYQPQIIGLYKVSDHQTTLTASLFNVVQVRYYFIFIIMLAIFQVSILLYKFVLKKWTFPLAILNTVYNLAFSCLFLTMATDHSLYNLNFIKQVAKMTTTPIAAFDPIWWSSLKSIAIFVIIGCSIDSLIGFIKAKNNQTNLY